jgi:DNA-binding GntR family transcriptional regulator
MTRIGPHPRTISVMIAEVLREQILDGEIALGARLRQNDIAKQLDVSSTPVREALAELIRQGLATGTPQRGVEVFRPTTTDVIEASEVQELLESHCVAASVPLLSDDDLVSARRLLEEHRAIPVSRRREGVELDTAFHLALQVRCSNGKLRRLAENARRDTDVHRLLLIPADRMDDQVVATIHDQHDEIYAACADRDAEAAADRTAAHIRWSRELFQEFLSKTEA